jgi:hypothetical protein
MLVVVNVNNKMITICWIVFHETGVQRSLLDLNVYFTDAIFGAMTREHEIPRALFKLYFETE